MRPMAAMSVNVRKVAYEPTRSVPTAIVLTAVNRAPSFPWAMIAMSAIARPAGAGTKQCVHREPAVRPVTASPVARTVLHRRHRTPYLAARMSLMATVLVWRRGGVSAISWASVCRAMWSLSIAKIDVIRWPVVSVVDPWEKWTVTAPRPRRGAVGHRVLKSVTGRASASGRVALDRPSALHRAMV